MNHQDIADRLKNLGDEKSKALVAEEARIERERLSLQELCGGMGHIYVKPADAWGTVIYTSSKSAAAYKKPAERSCAVCGKEEV